MLVALGSFAYKYYSMDPANPKSKSIENAITVLLEKIDTSLLKIEVFRAINFSLWSMIVNATHYTTSLHLPFAFLL
jgi:hypothetical protein